MKKINFNVILFISFILMEFLLILFGVKFISYKIKPLIYLSKVIALVFCVFLLTKTNFFYKNVWIIVIMTFPFFGIVCYLLTRRSKKQFQKIFIKKTNNIKSEVKIFNFLESKGFYPSFNNVSYFSNGEDFFEELILQLKSAKKFIFMEFFIIKEGFLFDRIYEIISKKVEEGVKVKIIYDSIGCIKNFPKKLKDDRFDLFEFNSPYKPFADVNYRNHRKIVIIDGEVGFLGGVNIGDEYINKEKRFGHWQDTGVKIGGEGVLFLTKTFLETFSLKKEIKKEEYFVESKEGGESLVVPFFTGGEECFYKEMVLSFLYQAKKTITFITPYLALDGETVNAFISAVKSGVKVGLIIPNVPDKKMVYDITLYYAEKLAQNGVDVFTYTPGFTHSKMIVIDEEFLVVGSHNLDFRSFFFQLESGAVIKCKKIVKEASNNLEEIIKFSKKFEKNSKKKGVIRKIFYFFLKIFVYYI